MLPLCLCTAVCTNTSCVHVVTRSNLPIHDLQEFKAAAVAHRDVSGGGIYVGVGGVGLTYLRMAQQVQRGFRWVSRSAGGSSSDWRGLKTTCAAACFTGQQRQSSIDGARVEL